jgi:hypothetical protein
MKNFTISKKLVQRTLFIVTGVASTIWFLVRVIPKPQRATYPCVRAAAPIASSFIIYILSISGSAFLFKRSIHAFRNNKYLVAASLIAGFMVFASVSLMVNDSETLAASTSNILSYEEAMANHPDNPIGTPQGINPGRVAWMHNLAATNENMVQGSNNYWYMDKNCDQDTVTGMFLKGLNVLTGENNPADAWDALFRHLNQKRGKGDVGYVSGEKVTVKINLTNSCCGMSGYTKQSDKDRMDTSPQMAFAMLESLIEDAGVAESDIYFGDTYRKFREEFWDKCHSVYPNVHYVDGHGTSGREQTVPSSEEVLVFSNGSDYSTLPEHYINSEYFVNMSCLKSHDQGGITMGAKNHQGSYLRNYESPSGQYAVAMHDYMPNENPGFEKYRHLVDYMSHEHTGGKTVLYLVEGLWAGENWEGNIMKWDMSPFDEDYPNSIFLSQDPVAIEAVGYDFLLEEFKDESRKLPQMNGANDYLYQAASSAYWPSGIQYDPEDDGSVIPSQGVYEHWDSPETKQYSGNSVPGTGIELVYNNQTYTRGTVDVHQYALNRTDVSVYPNPFVSEINFNLDNFGAVEKHIRITSLSGQDIYYTVISEQEDNFTLSIHDFNDLTPGVYHYTISGNRNVATGTIIYE